MIAGHSHVTALGVPLKSSDGANQLIALPGETSFEAFTGAWPRARDYWDALIHLSATRRLAIAWMGNQHNSRFMILPPPGFDFVCSVSPEMALNPAATLVAETAVRESFRESLRGLEWLLGKITQSGGALPVLLGTPPPKADNEAIRRVLVKEPHFVRVARQMGLDLTQVPLSSPLLRVKLWRLLQKMTAEVGERFSVPFWPSAPAAETADGFLRPEFWAEDATHANSFYGTLMLRRMEQLNDSAQKADFMTDKELT